jgi:hypothetical protein
MTRLRRSEALLASQKSLNQLEMRNSKPSSGLKKKVIPTPVSAQSLLTEQFAGLSIQEQEEEEKKTSGS